MTSMPAADKPPVQAVEFAARRGVAAVPAPLLDSWPSLRPIEGVAGGRLRIERKSGRPHNEYGAGALRFSSGATG